MRTRLARPRLSTNVEMSKNFTLFCLSIIAVVAVIAVYWVNGWASSNASITLGLRSYTNATAVITVTNRSNVQFDYGMLVERKPKGGWPTELPIGTLFLDHGTVPPGVTTLTVPVMVHVPPLPWRISMFCTLPPGAIKVNPIPQAAAQVLYKLGLKKLSLKVAIRDYRRRGRILVSTPEVGQ
jgi:hypothetical protein